MKLKMVIVTVLFCILMLGCYEDVEEGLDNQMVNSQLVRSYNDIAMQNAIISQHTLFPYHFITDGKELNKLGQRDLAVLTSHYLKYPGRLNIRRHNTSAELYKDRVNLVHKKLQEAGIDVERIRLTDDMPGGSGITSERIITILQQETKAISTSTSSQ